MVAHFVGIVLPFPLPTFPFERDGLHGMASKDEILG
jgi:hypothetical protein